MKKLTGFLSGDLHNIKMCPVIFCLSSFNIIKYDHRPQWASKLAFYGTLKFNTFFSRSEASQSGGADFSIRVFSRRTTSSKLVDDCALLLFFLLI